MRARRSRRGTQRNSRYQGRFHPFNTVAATLVGRWSRRGGGREEGERLPAPLLLLHLSTPLPAVPPTVSVHQYISDALARAGGGAQESAPPFQGVGPSPSPGAPAPKGGCGQESVSILKQACSPECQGAQGAFKDSMIHGILQFTLRIAFRCVLHRCESQEIRCQKLFFH